MNTGTTFDFALFPLECPHCGQVSLEPIRELVGKDVSPCQLCSRPIDLAEQGRLSAIREFAESAKQVKKEKP